MAVSGNALLQSALEANWHAGDGRLPCLWGSLKARCHFFKSPFRSRAEEVLAKAEQTGMKPSFTSTPSRPRSGMSAASAATVPAVNTSPINTRQHPQSGADGRGSGERHMYLMPFPRATPHQTDRGQSLRLAGGIPCRSSSSGLLEARRHHPRPDHIHALHGRTAHKNRMQGNDFVQSVMYEHGVTCASCPNVHGTENMAQLRKPVDKLYLDCHGPTSPNGPHTATLEGTHPPQGRQPRQSVRSLPYAEDRNSKCTRNFREFTHLQVHLTGDDG
jgi:hypothetical protein